MKTLARAYARAKVFDNLFKSSCKIQKLPEKSDSLCICALSRDNARTHAKKRTLEEQLHKLIELAESKEGQRFCALELGGTGRTASADEEFNLAA